MRYNYTMEAKKRKNFIVLGCVAAGLTTLLVLLLWLRTLSPEFSDFVCKYVSRPWVYVIGHINSLLPFSVFELCILSLIIAAIVLLVLGIRALARGKSAAVLKGMLVAVIAVVSVFDFYTLTVGFAYYRPEVPVPQSEKEYSPEEVTQMIKYFAADYNALAEKFERDEFGNVISPYTFSELSDKLAEQFAKIDGDYFYGYTPKAKPLVNSWFLTLNNISGITFVPLGEPTVNKDIPASDLPQTMAHEMAHAKGVMREGDANFVSYYLLLSSSDDYLRYCGYFSTFFSALSAVNANTSKKDDYLEISRAVSPLIRTELNNAYRFWSEKSQQPGFAGWLNRTFEKISDFVNDLFLKSNGADNGNGSYLDKVTDGSISDSGVTNPDTGEIYYDVTYSSLQKMYFAVYEEKQKTFYI